MNTKATGFTLAELLIALAILGVIATFTIPKLLDTTVSQKNSAIVKEAAAMFAGAYQTYKLNSTPSASTSVADLTPYMNYVKSVTDGVTVVDNEIGGANTRTCSAGAPCYILHNGAVLTTYSSFYSTFGGTAATDSIFIIVDPDGKYGNGGNVDGPSKSVAIFLFFNGRLRTQASIPANTCVHSDCTFQPAADPSWFTWN